MRQDRFERLYAEHAQQLFGFLVYRTGDRALAEDLVAETFERALRARVRFDARRGREKTWLYAIALNLLRDHARKDAAERRALARVESAVDPNPVTTPVATMDERLALRRALDRLTPLEREAVSLRYGADLALAEIARLADVPVSTVEGRVYRALAKLREELG